MVVRKPADGGWKGTESWKFQKVMDLWTIVSDNRYSMCYTVNVKVKNLSALYHVHCAALNSVQ